MFDSVNGERLGGKEKRDFDMSLPEDNALYEIRDPGHEEGRHSHDCVTDGGQGGKGDFCKSDWLDFTENTTLHGLRYIWMRDSTFSRR